MATGIIYERATSVGGVSLRINSVIRDNARIANDSGSLADPTTVAFTLTSPVGDVTTPTAVRVAVGVYHADFTADTAGDWTFSWTATGTLEASLAGTIAVADAPAPLTGWHRCSERMLNRLVERYGQPVFYSRVGYDTFPMVGIVDIIPHLESVDRGKFYAVTMRDDDFMNAPLRSQVVATFSMPPNNGNTITFDGVTYTFFTNVANTIADQVARGTNYAQAAQNLCDAINANPATAGVNYSTPTLPHPTCTARVAANAVTVLYKQTGPAGDVIVAAESAYGVSLDRTVFRGGGPQLRDIVRADGLVYNVSDFAFDGEGSVELRLELSSNQ